MKRQKSNDVLFIGGIIVVIVLALVMIFAPERKAVSDGIDANTPTDPNLTTNGPEAPSAQGPSDNGPDDNEPSAEDSDAVALKDVINLAQTWMPCDLHRDWIGKPAPDFTVMDIDGKQHQLSSYRGKPVILFLWAQWFKPSTNELETLIQLKKNLADKVVILALSLDAEAIIKRFLMDKPGINFPIICSLTQSIPAPYSVGKPLPCAMIIAPDGTLKISVRGTVPLDDYHALLAAK